MKLSEPSKLPRTNILYISDFSPGSPGVRSVTWPPHYKTMGNTETDYFAKSYNPIPSMQNICVNYWLHTPRVLCLHNQHYMTSCMTSEVSFDFILVFLSITSDQFELERREGHQCVPNELPNPMIYNITTLGQDTDLSSRELTLTWGQREPWPFLSKKYIIQRVLGRRTRWCQTCSHIIL